MKNVSQNEPETKVTSSPRTPEKERAHRMAIVVAFLVLALYIGFAQAGIVDMVFVFAVTYGIARLLSVKIW